MAPTITDTPGDPLHQWDMSVDRDPSLDAPESGDQTRSTYIYMMYMYIYMYIYIYTQYIYIYTQYMYTPPYFTVEVRMEKPVGLHGSRLRPIPGEKWNWATGPANAEKLTVNHLHGSSLKEHVQHGSWKTETKNAYVEVTWRSKHQVGNFYVNMFSPHVEYILLGRSLKPPDWPPHHLFSSLHLSSHPRHAGHPYLKNNHQRVQVWIQHQKFTNRAFYIKSLIKKKTYEKPGVGFMSFPSFWEMKPSWEVWGTLVPNQRFYHE